MRRTLQLACRAGALRTACATAALALGCAGFAGPVAATPPLAMAAPEALFLGSTTGRGTLRLGLGRERPFRVRSEGTPQPDGTFRLDQVVSFEGEPPRRRHWILRPARGGSTTFVLSDAAGPGTATVEGTRLLLRYPLGRGLQMRQELRPSADGRTIDNTGSVRWLGLPVGRLEETITRQP